MSPPPDHRHDDFDEDRDAAHHENHSDYPDPSVVLPLLLGLLRSVGRRAATTTTGAEVEDEADVEAKVETAEGDEEDDDDDDARVVFGLPSPLSPSEAKDPPTFPKGLHRILSRRGRRPAPRRPASLSWSSHGRSFLVEVAPDVAADDATALEAAKTRLEGELRGWGFRRVGRRKAAGGGGAAPGTAVVEEYHHPMFLRGRLDLVGEMTRRDINDDDDDKQRPHDRGGDRHGGRGGGNGVDDAPTGGGGDDDDNIDDNRAAIDDFLSFTGISDANLARRYLEMSGGVLETAVGLFVDHGDVVGGGGGADFDVDVRGVVESGKEGGDDGDEDDDYEEGPDFDSLPPMPPLEDEEEDGGGRLDQASPSPAACVVESALREYQAFRTLQRALLRHLMERRRQKPGLPPLSSALSSSPRRSHPPPPVETTRNAKKEGTSTRDRHHHGTHHFLFRSLLHPSLPVRRAAVRIILQNYHRVRQRRVTTDGKSSLPTNNGDDGLREALIVLLHSLMFGEPPYQQQRYRLQQQQQTQETWPSRMTLQHSTMMIPCYKNQPDGGDPALQIMGMLIALVCDGGFSNLVVCNEVRRERRLLQRPGVPPLATHRDDAVATTMMSYSRDGVRGRKKKENDDDGVLAKTFLQELSTNYGIETFVAGGGLRWACGSIVRLVHILVHGLPSPHPLVAGKDVFKSSGSDDMEDRDDHHHYAKHNRQEGGSAAATVPLDDITSRTVQTRLLLLIDLVYRLVLFGSVPAAVDRHGSLTDGDDDNIGAGDEGDQGKEGGTRGWGSRGPSKFGISDVAAVNSCEKQLHRVKARELYDLAAASSSSSSSSSGTAAENETLRASSLSLRQPLRSSIMDNPHPVTASGGGGGAKRSFPSAGGGTLTNLGVAASSAAKAGGGASGGGGGGDSNEAVTEENRQRKDLRRATLERVHNMFWSSTLPAAICVLPPALNKPTAAAAANNDNGIITPLSPSPLTSESEVQLSPLACLIAAHEILRSRPLSHSTLATNNQLFTVEKGIAILGRIVDPNASNALVVVDKDLPWGLADILLGGDGGSGKSYGVVGEFEVKAVLNHSKKRDRASSHERHPLRSFSSSSQHLVATTAMRSLPPRRSAAGGDGTSSGEGVTAPLGHHRAKRARTATTTSASVNLLLERMARVEATAASSMSNPVARSAREEPMAAAASLSASGLSSTYASRYRSAMESMMRSSTAGSAASISATSTSAAAALRNDRDGSLSRLIATRVERLGSSRPGSLHSASTSAALPVASAAPNRSLLRGARDMTSAEVEEWRVLHELPEGGDVMDIDEHDFSNDDDNDDDDEEFVSNSNSNSNNNNVNEEGESGEVEEGNRDNSEVDEDDDSDNESAFEEVVHPDNIDEYNDHEENNFDEVDDDSGSEEDEAAVGGNNNYEEETDDDDEVYDTSQFDDAVINLDDINLATSGNQRLGDDHDGHHLHGHSSRNPHRQLSSRGNAASSRLGIGGSAGSGGVNSGINAPGGLSPIELALKKREREQVFLCAAMSILAAQYLELMDIGADRGKIGNLGSQKRPQQELITPLGTSCNSMQGFSIFARPCATSIITPPLLTSNAEQSLLKSLCNIVKPPRKPLNLKIFLRRAPTQEEFFRGSLNRNPIGLSSLRAAGATSSGGGGGTGSASGEEGRTTGGVGGSSGSDEPLVSDLRLHIAKDLQMEDSAELLELLVANKILDVNLKLRVVQQVLWKRYVEENATSASSLGVAGAGPSHQMISTGSGLSMIFSSSGLVAARNRANAGEGSGGGADDNTILESFPPMVVTYRLAGVDGEATEDKVELEDLEDPEAPSTANQSPAAIEQRMEKEFGITRMMLTQHEGVAVLLASVQRTISDLLRRIRRDEVARRRLLRNSTSVEADVTASNEGENVTREQFSIWFGDLPPGLLLLRYCANISDNRKKMLANRAPTLLLRILLDILNAMNRSSGTSGKRQGYRQRSSTFDFSVPSADVSPVLSRKRVHHVEGNPTTNALQEIIEMLASDISAEISGESKSLKISGGSFVSLNELESSNIQQAAGGMQQDEDRTLPLVLKSLHSTDLGPPLRKVIAKLLPFLTYGRVSQSKELASCFNRYVNVDRLGMMNGTEASEEQEQQLQFSVLMHTFVETAINLPPVSVCDNLRKELISNGFVERVRCFLLEDAPHQPPSWSPALYSKSSNKMSEGVSSKLKEEWRLYLDRPGLSQAFKILIGLCSRHIATQLLLSDISSCDTDDDVSSTHEDDILSLLTLCHWLESTSDNTVSDIKNPNGILAETLLDALKEDNALCAKKIGAIRNKTRDRKRELADERRSKALVGMSAFGKLAGAAVAGPRSASTVASHGDSGSGIDANVFDQGSSENRSVFASMFSSLLAPSHSQQRTRSAKGSTPASQSPQQPKAQPSWMEEMEAMADEAGVTCAVCQEGRTLQPSELLGMYAYMKKISVPSSQGGGKGDIDGTVLLLSLPTSFPNALVNSTDMEALFTKARSAAIALEGTSHALSAMSLSTSISGSGGGAASGSRTNVFLTSVSAGNAIHINCHKKAKTADRNHPKAPKSEWEGASLRNSRVTCNVIIPLVSSKTSKVPLIAVDTALADYNASITNTLGARPKSILWNCLHDMRFILLRMAHGEALGADCGGGSSSSNFLLLLYQLYSADMFAKNAEHDESLEVSRHARGLSAGFLVGVGILDDPDFDRIDNRLKRLERGVADAAPMAALLSILFYNDGEKATSGSATKTHDLSGSEERKIPSPTRQWEVYKSKFLAGLMRCAGHRHSLGVTDSGCVTSRGISTGRKNIERARLYKDWTSDDAESMGVNTTWGGNSARRTTMIDAYSKALRPMITLYAILDQLSKDFAVGNCDEKTSESAEHLAAKLDSCYKANDIQELLRVADISVGNDVICKYFEKGATS